MARTMPGSQRGALSGTPLASRPWRRWSNETFQLAGAGRPVRQGVLESGIPTGARHERTSMTSLNAEALWNNQSFGARRFVRTDDADRLDAIW